MTYTQMKDFFLILKDKFGSPYFTDDEIALLLNRAQLDQVVALLPIDGGPINIELNANTKARIAPLLFTVTQAMTPVTGLVSKATVSSLLDTPILRLLAIGYNGFPVSDVKINNWYPYKNNIFKEATASDPLVLENADTWQFLPVDTTATITIHGVRYPVEMLSDGSVDCELPDFVHNDVVSRALELAGVGSRDQMLSELKKLNAV